MLVLCKILIRSKINDLIVILLSNIFKLFILYFIFCVLFILNFNVQFFNVFNFFNFLCIRFFYFFQGRQCSLCKSRFVGDLIERKLCVFCFVYCNNYIAACFFMIDYSNRIFMVFFRGNNSMLDDVRWNFGFCIY